MKWTCSEMYREQVNTISAWFDQWNECEQTVALYSLLKRLTPIKARFLSLALDQSLSDCSELQIHEHQANNPGFVSSLLAESKEVALAQLLQHLPLLKPGNYEARTRYLSVIHKVLSHSVETGAHIEEARQLLSYSLIHPALGNEDRRALTQWLKHLEDRITMGSTEISALSQISSHPRIRRSNSLTPPVTATSVTCDLWSSQDDLVIGGGRHKPRSFSLSSDHAPPLSPQSSLASSGSGSESHLDDLRSLGFTSDACGMRDVATWLKTLRLHKYVALFMQLSYDEMMALTEEWLQSQGVTKGARHKIIISVRKLKERFHTLCQLEKDISEGCNLNTVLEELKAILISPLKPSHIPEREDTETEEDIPSQFTRVMGKVCTQLIVSRRTAEEEVVLLFVWLLERSLLHEAFTLPQKKRLSTWRLQIHDVWNPQLHKQLQQTRFKWHHSHLHPNRTLRFPAPACAQLYQPRGLYSASVKRPSQEGSTCFEASQPQKQQANNNFCGLSFASKCSVDGNDPTEINSRLESLCLSMTEHALSGCGEV